MAERANITNGPHKGMKRSDCERTERTMGNILIPFVPTDSQLLHAEGIKFKLKETPGKRGTGEFAREVNRLESQSSVADYLTWKESRAMILTINQYTEIILGGEVLGSHKVKKHQAANQETPSANDVDEVGDPVIVNRGVTQEAFETCGREFEKLFIKTYYARD